MKKYLKTGIKEWISIFWVFILFIGSVDAQTAMINTQARNTISLNGDWQVIIDLVGAGDWRQVWQEKKPQKKTDFLNILLKAGPY